MITQKLHTDETVYIDSAEKFNYYRLNYSLKRTKIEFHCNRCHNKVSTILYSRKSFPFPLYCGKCQRIVTSLEKYGVENPGGSKEAIAKIKKTKLERHGSEKYNNSEKQRITYNSKSDEEKTAIKIKTIKTKLEKYGEKLMSEEGLRRISIKQHENKETRCKKGKETKLLKYGNANYNNMEKMLHTKEEKYGSSHYYNLTKAKNTNNKKYGVDFFVMTDEFKEKVHQNMYEKHGVNWPTQIPEVIEKCKQTCLEKYGVVNYTQTAEFKERVKQTCLKKYGTTYPVSHFSRSRSWLEDEIIDYIKTITSAKYQTNNRILLHGKEIDIYFPELNKAIEIQGTYWHADPNVVDESFFNKTKNMSAKEIWEYDANKKKEIEALGISLFYVWENDWVTDIEKVKNELKEYLI